MSFLSYQQRASSLSIADTVSISFFSTWGEGGGGVMIRTSDPYSSLLDVGRSKSARW